MSPKQLLQLWRARWDKSDDGIPNRPYARGSVHVWSYQLCNWKIWESAIIRWIVLSLASFVLFIALKLEFSLNGQITFAGLLIATIIAARRFEGALFTFVILAVAAIACAQYFYWRLTKTLVLRSECELLLSITYCAIEMLLCTYLAIRLYSQNFPIDLLNDVNANAVNLSSINLSVARRIKHWATAIEDVIVFYQSIGILAIVLLPIVGLLLGYSFFKGKSDMIAPMIAPYLVAIAVMVERLEMKRRWGLFKALQEVALACVLSARNALAFVRYSLQNKALFFERSFAKQSEPFAGLKSAVNYGLISLNLAAGLSGLFTPDLQASASIQAALVALAAINVVLLIGTQAVAHESRHIQWFCNIQQSMHATIIFASGRTMTCETCNFPSTELQLRLPTPIEQQNGEDFVLQFRHGHRPFNLTVRASAAGDSDDASGNIIRVSIDASSVAEFELLKTGVMARDANWPNWLANKDADRLLPVWFSEKLQSVPMQLIDWMTKFFGIMKLKTVLNLFRNKPEN